MQVLLNYYMALNMAKIANNRGMQKHINELKRY